ncbi:MAG: aminotransferase class V-fold PLP-dependent enzyme, partial [Exilispira sp.]
YSLFTIADGVSAFLSEYIYQEKNNIDALILGSQKGFNAPAGISFVSLSLRAINQIKDLDISSYYFDLNKYLFVPPFTPAINTIFYIYNFLKMIEKINLLNIIERNRQIALKIRNFCLKFNINQYSLEPSSAISVFEYEKSKQFIEFCKNNYRLYIGTGQGILKDKVFRIGHLGLTPLKYYNIFQIALNKFIKINSRMKI